MIRLARYALSASVVLLLVLLLASYSEPSRAPRSVVPSAAVARADSARVPRFSKVAVLFLENRGYREIIGNRHAPFLNSLAEHHGLATNYYAVSHPSLPNYLALTTGSTLGIRRDCNACDTRAPTLMSQLDTARIPWKAYFEGIPSPGFEGRRAGDYSKHYNPFVYSEMISDTRDRSKVVGFGALGRDLRQRTLPRVAWIAPDLLHDGHNGSVRASDRFASNLIPRLDQALGPNGILFVTWDEAHGRQGPAGGHVALIATGRRAQPRARVGARASHYSLLATIESGLRLPTLGHAGDQSNPLLTKLLRH